MKFLADMGDFARKTALAPRTYRTGEVLSGDDNLDFACFGKRGEA